ncbi:MAG: hypothetical protein IPN49_08475 [Saprospiraceae bacterium]|nr:hypothetical protein [Saprospiraceae bacterium]MBK8369953.1 hypothetical protein [Saprospiraceae bacterium]MBK8819110.1 hypothetical protein [Saprospiraceae bacterium]
MKHYHLVSFSVVIFFLFQGVLLSQSKVEIPLLLNTQPQLAIVDDSAEIVKVVRPLPGFMDGYILESPKYETVVENTPKSTSFSGYSIISSDSYVIAFRSGFAVIDDVAADNLDLVVRILKESPNKNLLLSVFNEYMRNPLYKNRINAIKMYAKIEGISLDRIKFNYLEGKGIDNEIKLNFIE